MSEPRFNGWHNHATWLCHLWLGNDEATYTLCRQLAAESRKEAPTCWQVRDGVWKLEEAATFLLADRLKAWIEEHPLLDQPSVYSDLLTSALTDIDWQEVAQAFLEE